jgi:hypothetical protein
MWTTLRRSKGLSAPLIIFVLTLIIVGFVTFAIKIVYHDYSYLFGASLIMIIYFGIPLGLGSILIFLGLRLKIEGDSVWGYGLVLGLGALILVGVAVIMYLLYLFSTIGN